MTYITEGDHIDGNDVVRPICCPNCFRGQRQVAARRRDGRLVRLITATKYGVNSDLGGRRNHVSML